MPPIPRTKPRVPPKASPISPGTGAGTGPTPRLDSPPNPGVGSVPPKPGRKTQRDLLKDRLERLYMMLGTIFVPFGKFIPALEPIGNNLKEFSKEAADAWMELADEDSKVKSYLESVTGASTWGNVIGIHFAIFATAIPSGSPIGSIFGGTSTANPTDGTYDPIAAARAAGLPEEQIQEAMRMGERMAAGDTIRSDRAPDEAPTPNGPVRPGIVDPATLGVTQPGEVSPMPADGGPIRGA